MNFGKIAVALSIYRNDKLHYIKESITSIIKQTYINYDIYIMVDGEISYDVRCYLESLSFNFPNIYVFFKKNNKGLAYRLNQIIKKIINKKEYSYIARMDADDISVPERFEKQVMFLEQNKDISVVGCDVLEIDSNGVVLFYKKMRSKHCDIVRDIIKRCPFNHPSVMFNLAKFPNDSFIFYNEKLMNTQDYYLWIDLLANGHLFHNINEPLLYFRVDDNFHDRRGVKKVMNELKSRLYALHKLDNLATPVNILYILLLVSLRLSPKFIKKIAYGKFRN